MNKPTLRSFKNSVHEIQKNIKAVLIDFAIKIHVITVDVEVKKTKSGFNARINVVSSQGAMEKGSEPDVKMNDQHSNREPKEHTGTEYKDRLQQSIEQIVHSIEDMYSALPPVLQPAEKVEHFTDLELYRIRHVLGGILECGRVMDVWNYALHQIPERSYKKERDGSYILTLPSGVKLHFSEDFSHYSCALPLLVFGEGHTEQQIIDRDFLTKALPGLQHL